MTIRLYLVRHGETPMNQAGKLQGITDAPLTARGQLAAKKLGELLKDVPFKQAFSSDRQRAVDTANEILSFHNPMPPLKQLTGLREYYFGGLEGQSEQRLFRRIFTNLGIKAGPQLWFGPERFDYMIHYFKTMDPTGQAESLAELNSRVRAAFDQVETQSPDGDVLVVAHGVVLSALIRLIDPTDLPLTLLKNTSVSRIDIDGDDWRVVGVNLTSESELAKLE